MNRRVMSVVIGMVVTAAAAAYADRTGKSDGIAIPDKGRATYTGCLEAGRVPGTFTLTHVSRIEKGSPTMMPSTNLLVLSTSLGLSHEVGHTIQVTGSHTGPHKGTLGMGEPTLNIKTLKMVAASCS